MLHLSYIVMHRVEQFPSLGEFEGVLSLLKSLGYEGVELNMTGWLLNNLNALESLVDKSQLRLCSFLTGEAYFDGLCLTSPDPGTRERAISRLLQCVEAARRLRCLFVVGMLQGTARDEPNTELAEERIFEGLRVVAAVSERQNVQFVIEPVNHLQVGFNNSVAEVRQLLVRPSKFSFSAQCRRLLNLRRRTPDADSGCHFQQISHAGSTRLFAFAIYLTLAESTIGAPQCRLHCSQEEASALRHQIGVLQPLGALVATDRAQ